MKPKPPADEHAAALLRVLTAGLGRTLPAAAEWLRCNPERFTLISWTKLFYDVRRDIRADLPGLERLLNHPVPNRAERREIDSLTRRAARLWHIVGDSVPLLTRVMASSDLKVTLADVRRYLGDVDGVGSRIRALLKRSLREAWGRAERILLIGHSLGSVVAYDSLWELSRAEHVAGRVDLFVTLGSPLATRFIRHGIKGAGHRSPERYPKNIRRWENFSARGEMVALHPRLAPFFGRMVAAGVLESLVDHPGLYNCFHAAAGLDVHKCYAYLSNAEVLDTIGAWLGGAL